MNSGWLHLKAPFAAFRWMQAGVYRATSPVIPPSTAWGLILNLAGIDARDYASSEVATPTRKDAPKLSLAIGNCIEASVSTLYQQLHSYPVGSSGKDLAKLTHGAKYWIAPARREVLVDFEGVLGVRCSENLLKRVRLGLEGKLETSRYGLPFAGDNNLLFDSIRLLPSPPEAYWYVPANDILESTYEPTCRLTVSIDRTDSSRTVTRLFARTQRLALPPEKAWIETPIH